MATTGYASATAGYGFSTSATQNPAVAPVGLAPIPVPLVTPEPTRFPTLFPTMLPTMLPTTMPVAPIPSPTILEVTDAPVTSTEAPVTTMEPTPGPTNTDPPESTMAPAAHPPLDPTAAPITMTAAPDRGTTDPTKSPVTEAGPVTCDPNNIDASVRDDGAVLLWAEEFNYDGAPHAERWSYDLGGGGWGNQELQVYTDDPDNVVVDGCALNIMARRQASTDGSEDVFTSARIKTEHKVSFTYGSLETRIKVPDMEAGLWPAFWTLGSDMYQVGWPRAGEIDILEMGQGLAINEGLVNHRVVSAAHWDLEGQYATYARWLDASRDLTQDFHIYRMEWTPTSIANYVDDEWIWEMDITEEKCTSCQELHSPHHIMLNLAVGGGFTSSGTSSSAAGGASSSSSGSSCAGSSSSAGASSSSSGGGCAARGPEDITAPLPGVLLVDWIRLYDNGDTILIETPDGLAETIPPTKLTPLEVPDVPATETKSIPVTEAPITTPPVSSAPVSQAPVSSSPVSEVPTTLAPVTPPPASVTKDQATLSPAGNDVNAELLARGFLRNGDEKDAEESSKVVEIEASAMAASSATTRWGSLARIMGLAASVLVAQLSW